MAEITFNQWIVWRKKWVNSKRKQANNILQFILFRKCRILQFRRLDSQFQALSKMKLILMRWNALIFHLGRQKTKMLVRQLQPSLYSPLLLLQKKMVSNHSTLWYLKTDTKNHQYHFHLLCELKIKMSLTELSLLQEQFSSGRLQS
jgi:hypothetical protein